MRTRARRGHELAQGACRAGGEKQPHSGYVLKSVPAGCPDGLEVKCERKRVRGDGQGLRPNTWKDRVGTIETRRGRAGQEVCPGVGGPGAPLRT